MILVFTKYFLFSYIFALSIVCVALQIKAKREGDRSEQIGWGLSMILVFPAFILMLSPSAIGNTDAMCAQIIVVVIMCSIFLIGDALIFYIKDYFVGIKRKKD